jgi:hypothetical protein
MMPGAAHQECITKRSVTDTSHTTLIPMMGVLSNIIGMPYLLTKGAKSLSERFIFASTPSAVRAEPAMKFRRSIPDWEKKVKNRRDTASLASDITFIGG